MKQVYVNAINLVMKRIKACGVALQNVSDEHSLLYWQLELSKANYLKSRIQKRLKLNHNVIKIDFQAKKRVA
jgi:hypothetical protein